MDKLFKVIAEFDFIHSLIILAIAESDLSHSLIISAIDYFSDLWNQ